MDENEDEEEAGARRLPPVSHLLLFSIIEPGEIGAQSIDLKVYKSVQASDSEQGNATSLKRQRQRQRRRRRRRRRRRCCWRWPNHNGQLSTVLLIVMLAGLMLAQATSAAAAATATTATQQRLLRDTSNYNHDDLGEMAPPEVGLDEQRAGDQVLNHTTTWHLLGEALFPAANGGGGGGGNIDNYDTDDDDVDGYHQRTASVNWANLILALLLVLLILTTAIGNLFVIVAILIERNLRTVGNYLVLSLAFADLLVALLVMPPASIYLILDGWTLGLMLCDLWTSADVFCCTASILHLLAIALDRYWAVTRVDYIRCQRNNRRIAHMISGVWLAALVISIAPVFGWKDDQFERRITHDKECLISQDIGYQIFATCTTFYFPLCLTLIFYWKIYQVARKRIRKKLDNRAKFAPANPSSTSSGSSPTQAGSLTSKQQHATSQLKNQAIVDCAQKRDGNFKFTTRRLDCECACHRAAGRHKAKRTAAEIGQQQEQTDAERTTKRPPIVNGGALSASCEREQDANNKTRRLSCACDPGANQHRETSLACDPCTKHSAIHRFRAVGRENSAKSPGRNTRSTSDLRSNSLASCSRTSSLQASSSCQDNHHAGGQPATAARNQQQVSKMVTTATSGCAHSSLSSNNVDGVLLMEAEEEVAANFLNSDNLELHNTQRSPPAAVTLARRPLGAQRQSSSGTCDCCTCTLCCTHQSLTDVANNCDDFVCEQPTRPTEEGPELFPIGEQGDDSQGPNSEDSSVSFSRRSSSIAPDRDRNQQQQQQQEEVQLDQEEAQNSCAWHSAANTDELAMSGQGGCKLDGARLAPVRNMIAICWRRLTQATRTAATGEQADSEALVHTDRQSGISGGPNQLDGRQMATGAPAAAAAASCDKCQCPLVAHEGERADDSNTMSEEFGRPAHRAHQGLLGTAAVATANLALTTADGLESRAVASLVEDGAGPAAAAATRTRVVTSSVKLHQQHSVNSSSVAASHAAQMEGVESRRERKAAKTLAIITGVFVMCWLPFFVMALAMPLMQIKPPQIVFNFLLWLGYFNSMLNPIIYTIFSPDFRKAFKRLLLGSDDPAAQNRKQRQQRAQQQMLAEQSRQRARYNARETNGNGSAIVVVMPNGQTRHVLSDGGDGQKSQQVGRAISSN